MISAKNQAFRQQIRRRQIEDKFRARRNQYKQMEKTLASREQQTQFITQALSIIHNLNELASGDDYYVYQNLIDLKKLIKKKNKFLDIICKPEHLVVQSISQILYKINISQVQTNGKFIVFSLIIQIMNCLIQCQLLTSNRILKCQFIQNILPYMQINVQIQKHQTLQNLFGFLANSTRQSQQTANLYTKLKIPQYAIQLVKNSTLNQKSKGLRQFLFFLRSYFQQLRKPMQFTEQQIYICLSASNSIIECLIQEDIKHQQVVQQLQDALKVYKNLVDNQKFLKQPSQYRDIRKFVQLIQARNYPLQIKRQALYIIDGIIFICDEQTIEDLVQRNNLLNNIWGVDEQIKYIVFNIFSNLALYPGLKSQISPFMSRIRLELVLNPCKKYILMCILNYFKSQQFDVNGALEQSLINQLYKSENVDRDIMEIQANIWLGLVSHDYNQRPPLKILQAKNISVVDQIWYFLDRQKNIYDRMEDVYETEGKIISE